LSNSSEQVRRLAHAYGRGADAYATVLDPTLEPMALHMIEIAGVSAGHRIIDLATGTGAIARAAARTGARVVALDLSRRMLTVAQRLSPRSISFVLADASLLPLASRVFDAITCGLSLSHFIDVPTVLVEVRRTLRPGGVFVASAWGSRGTDPSFSAAFSVYERYTHNTPGLPSTLLDEASWVDPDRGREVIAGSGLASVEVITRRLTGTYQSAAAAVEWALAWPLTAEGCDQLPSAACEMLRAEALAAVEGTGQLEWYRDIHYYRAKATAVSAT
jgi:SAM-dependent methyltransferase